MPYKTIFRKRASKEYVETIAWYEERSLQAADDFVFAVSETLNEIESQPDHFQIVYKNYHKAKTKKYPFDIIYFVDNKRQTIVITTLFHQKRNPKNKFK